jgi:hypothetical protein
VAIVHGHCVEALPTEPPAPSLKLLPRTPRYITALLTEDAAAIRVAKTRPPVSVLSVAFHALLQHIMARCDDFGVAHAHAYFHRRCMYACGSVTPSLFVYSVPVTYPTAVWWRKKNSLHLPANECPLSVAYVNITSRRLASNHTVICCVCDCTIF